MKTVGIIGASGFTGHELFKILNEHSEVELRVFNSKNYVGQKVSSLYPDYQGDESYTGLSLKEINALHLDLIFLALPHAQSMDVIAELDVTATKLIDLSADYRFTDPEVYEKVYGRTQIPSKLTWIYGLPELFREEIKDAHAVANPGCYATASILAAYPIRDQASHVIFDCKSGWSGAGRDSKYAKNPEVLHDNLVAYTLTKHRHKYEIEQFIPAKVSFTPHVIDTFQGLLCTAHILLNESVNPDAVKQQYKEFYADAPFVRVTDEIPQITQTRKTNYCDIGGFEVDENNQLVIVSTLDNLWKGAAGQAVQNMNLMLGLSEAEGLV